MEIPTHASPEQLANDLATEYARGWVIKVDDGAYVVGTNDDSEGEDLGRWLPDADVVYYVSEHSGMVCEATVAYSLHRLRENERRAEEKTLPDLFRDEVDRERYEEAKEDLAAERAR